MTLLRVCSAFCLSLPTAFLGIRLAMTNNSGAPNPAGLRAASGYMPVSTLHSETTSSSQLREEGDDAKLFTVGTIWSDWEHAYQCLGGYGWCDRYDVLVSQVGIGRGERDDLVS